MMGTVNWIAKKEFAGYFLTPIALVFLVTFLLMSVCATFFWGQFFILNEASLRAYFYWLPFILAAFVPAVGMRMWCEERRQKTFELLLTMPIHVWQAVLGKFLAGVAFLLLGLLLSFPIPLTVLLLGQPDFGPMLCGYFGSLLLSAAMLAICSLLSAVTANQVISYVSSAVICLFLILGGHQSTMMFLREWLGGGRFHEMLAGLSVSRRFETFQRGVIDVGDCVYLLSIVAVFLLGTILVLQKGKR